MIKRVRFSLTALVAAGFLIVGLASPLVQAATQTSSSGNAIKIAPVRTDLTIQPGETRQISVTIQNLTTGPVEYVAIINDFVAGSGESGQPALILDANKYAPSHSLKRYIAPIPNVTVGGGQSKDVNVSIAIPKDAAAGGYYGAVRFAPAGGYRQTRDWHSAGSGSCLPRSAGPGCNPCASPARDSRPRRPASQ